MHAGLQNLSAGAGLFGLIPQNIRDATAGIASAIADPLDQMAKGVQGAANDIIKQFS